MYFGLTGDVEAESALLSTITTWSGPAEDHFRSKNYGDGLLGLAVVLVCRDPDLGFKRRVRHSKSDRKLFVDVVFELREVEGLDEKRRQVVVAQRLVDQVADTLRQRSIKDFDQSRFVADLGAWLATQVTDR